jgi:hypothetical protein
VAILITGSSVFASRILGSGLAAGIACCLGGVALEFVSTLVLFQSFRVQVSSLLFPTRMHLASQSLSLAGEK